jgi:C1q-related factor
VENFVGVVDVKSSPVYFHVQRNSTYNITGTAIPFQIERLNVGGGMNITSGIFTAPKSGIYFFSFTGLKENPADWLAVDLYQNSNYITKASATSIIGYLTVTLSSTLSVKSGDRISLRLLSGQLHDHGWYMYTNFNGILLQEEL